MTELPSDYQKYIHLSRYSRWREEDKRRETWEETVDRYLSFMVNHLNENLSYSPKKDLIKEIRDSILNLDVMPSMRCLMTAGKALKRDNIGAFNCSFIAVDDPRVFDEIMYVLMCGVGVGFSVEREFVNKLPTVSEEFHDTETTIVVADSKIGWATAYRELVGLLYSGKLPKWDLSRIRPRGSRLKTFGGRASGPEPLAELFRFTSEVFRGSAGRKLYPIECHDIICKVGQIVVVGGVRRSALISLSNLTDERMARAKTGAWWETNGHRALANNSVAYTEKPDVGMFLKEWMNLYESKSGERGIFSRTASKKQAARNGRRDPNFEFGTNPCSEIILRSKQVCNLTEVVIKQEDNAESLTRKVELATILGTWQSTLTDFRYLSSTWKKNTEEERLLGVSLTGIVDNKLTNSPDSLFLEGLRSASINSNRDESKRLKISPSTAITCIKPSGTVSQLCSSASGIHPRYSPYYIRTVRSDSKDPLTVFLKDQGVPNEPDVTSPDNIVVFSFPIKSPDNSIYRDDRSAIEQLEFWKMYQDHWCEHKPSVTIYVKENEWLSVGAWVYNNFDSISGVSFLPHSDHVYQQAPYQEITKEQYEDFLKKMPKEINWIQLTQYEKEDNTTGVQELACVAGICEI